MLLAVRGQYRHDQHRQNSGPVLALPTVDEHVRAQQERCQHDPDDGAEPVVPREPVHARLTADVHPEPDAILVPCVVSFVGGIDHVVTVLASPLHGLLATADVESSWSHGTLDTAGGEEEPLVTLLCHRGVAAKPRVVRPLIEVYETAAARLSLLQVARAPDASRPRHGSASICSHGIRAHCQHCSFSSSPKHLRQTARPHSGHSRTARARSQISQSLHSILAQIRS